MNPDKILTLEEVLALKDRLAQVGINIENDIPTPYAEIVDALLDKLGV